MSNTTIFKSHMLNSVVLGGIGIYQQWISPYKGFRCAHAGFYGTRSCSGYGRRLFQRFDVVTASVLLRRRFARCHDAYRRLVEHGTALANRSKRRDDKRRKRDDDRDQCHTGSCHVPTNLACDGVASCAGDTIGSGGCSP